MCQKDRVHNICQNINNRYDVDIITCIGVKCTKIKKQFLDMSFINIIQKNRENFLKFNNLKFQRMQEQFPSKNVARVINAIPLLLCVNDKRIPGYVEGSVPMGIGSFTPDESDLKFLKARFHLSKVNLFLEKPFVEMIAVMGSAGTIAHTRSSDYDYWICVNSRSVDKDAFSAFSKKVIAIQQWAMHESKIEIHLFINDIENIQRSIFAEDEEEAFGSTIGSLLKDEFYRSSIIVGGKVPFWWVVPRFAQDMQYDTLIEKVPSEIFNGNFVDLGNLYDISREDFLGAALFQLIKSLGSPFKSIIKIGVLERYLYSSDDSQLLCHKVKSNVQRGSFENFVLDSYILMFEEVYQYYEQTVKDEENLTILKQNLYLKINPQLSKYKSMKESSYSYKVKVMFQYIKDWKWNMTMIEELDSFDDWDYNKIFVFWNQIRRFMLMSYQRITQSLPSLNLQQKISDTDFMLITRKIKTHFSSEPNKIDQYITFKDTPHESLLFIEPDNVGIDDVIWKLNKRSKSTQNFVSTTVRREKDLIGLLAWAVMNQLYHPSFSRIKIQSGYNRINQNAIVELANDMANQFDDSKLPLKNEYFIKESFNLTNMIILNFNIEKADSMRSITHLYRTSWGESYGDNYSSAESLIPILEAVLKSGISLQRSFDEVCLIYSPESHQKLYKNIINQFKTIFYFITQSESEHSLRVISKFGNEFCMITRDGDDLKVIPQKNIIQILNTMSLRPRNMVKLFFSGEEKRLQLFQDIYEKASENAITLFYEEQGDYILLYVVNERGNLFSFMKKKLIKDDVLVYNYSFCKNIIKRINSKNYLPDIHSKIFTYKINTDRFGTYEFVDMTSNIEGVYLIKNRKGKAISGMVKRLKDGKSIYAFKMMNDQVNYADLSQLQFQVKSLDNDTAPVIHDMLFETLPLADFKLGSTIYFLEKYRMEFVIDKVIKM